VYENPGVSDACRICELNADVATLPLRERLYLDEHWRISHGWTPLPGWLVVASRRHVTALDELGVEEAQALGRLLQSASVALRQVLGCEKTYVMLFAEQPGYGHMHVHVVPRMPWFGETERSAASLRFLRAPEEEWVSTEERERLAEAIGRVMLEQPP
jgi:diadenosine tetraphosphate (Ap4A) HIT family hydrolase